MSEIKNIAQRVCSLYPSVIVAGGFALSNYYKHRLPTDLDLWNVPSGFTLAFSEKNVKSEFLTQYVVGGVSVDALSDVFASKLINHAPVYVDLVRCLDKRDLGVGTVNQLVGGSPLKISVFYDLFMLLTDFKPCELVSMFLNVYPNFDRNVVVCALTDFDAVTSLTDPLLLDCCGGWENVKSVITQKVRACLG